MTEPHGDFTASSSADAAAAGTATNIVEAYSTG